MIDQFEWIQLGGVFLGVGSLAFVFVSLVLRRSRPEEDRLGAGTEQDTAQRPVLGGYTTALADYLPRSGDASAALLNELRAAGYYRPTAVREYRALRNLSVLIAILATATIALLVPAASALNVLLGGLIVVGLAFSVPRLVVAVRARSRSHAIERGLPLAIDMLILCLSAGQNMLGALLQVSRQLRHTNPVLAQELTIAQQQAELHSLAHALEQWGERVRLPEVRNLVMVLVQSEKLGADAAATLDELATNFRTTARQRAETQANRASFWLLFPSVFCFWVAAALILIGPAFLEYTSYHQRSAETIRESTSKIKGLSPSGRMPPTAPSPGSFTSQNP